MKDASIFLAQVGLTVVMAFLLTTTAPAVGLDLEVGHSSQEDDGRLRVPLTIRGGTTQKSPLRLDRNTVRLKLSTGQQVPAVGFVVADPLAGSGERLIEEGGALLPAPSGIEALPGSYLFRSANYPAGIVMGSIRANEGVAFLKGALVVVSPVTRRVESEKTVTVSGRLRVERSLSLPLGSSGLILLEVGDGGLELDGFRATALPGSLLVASFTRSIGWHPVKVEGTDYIVEVLFEARKNEADSILFLDLPVRKVPKQ